MQQTLDPGNLGLNMALQGFPGGMCPSHPLQLDYYSFYEFIIQLIQIYIIIQSKFFNSLFSSTKGRAFLIGLS